MWKLRNVLSQDHSIFQVYVREDISHLFTSQWYCSLFQGSGFLTKLQTSKINYQRDLLFINIAPRKNNENISKGIIPNRYIHLWSLSRRVKNLFKIFNELLDSRLLSDFFHASKYNRARSASRGQVAAGTNVRRGKTQGIEARNGATAIRNPGNVL